MSVYVDRSRNPYGRMLMSHMIADTPKELRTMVFRIGVRIKWFQATASCPHFDICQSKRAEAVRLGAIELDRREYVEAMRRIRSSWPRNHNGWMLFCPIHGYAARGLKQLPTSED